MVSLRSLRAGLRALVRRNQVDREIHDEVRDYLEREREPPRRAARVDPLTALRHE